MAEPLQVGAGDRWPRRVEPPLLKYAAYQEPTAR